MCHRRKQDYSGNTYLGLQLGTERFRAVILDSQMKVQYTAKISYDVDLPEFKTSGGVLTDAYPDESLANPVMWVKALDMLLNCLSSQGADLHSVAAIGGAAQQHGCVFWSDIGLRRLCNLNPILRLHEQLNAGAFELTRTPIWMDGSAGAQGFEMEQKLGGSADLAAITGSRAYARFTGPQIRKVYQQCPEHYARTSRISLVSSFLSSLLVGGVASIDYCDGSGMNLLDINSRKWSEKCLEACAPDLARRLMKPIAPSRLQGRVADYYVKRWNFRPDCMVVPAIGIAQSRYVGMLLEKDLLMLSLDISDTMLVHLGAAHRKMDEGHVLCHPTIPNEYLGLLCFRNGSGVRQAFCEELADGDWERFNAMLDSTPMGNGGNTALHFYDREIVPEAKGTLRWHSRLNPMSQDALRGVEEFDRPETEARALIEGQLMHHRAIAQELGFQFGPNTMVVMAGSDSGNRSILQIVADVFNAPVYEKLGPGPCLLGCAYRARYAFYEHREATCSCRRCRKGRPPKQSFGQFFSKLPKDLRLVAEPRPGCEQIYAPLIVRCMNMCQLLAASTSIHDSHIIMET
ncbi:xylulose kinase [Drosophila obscura]|uniref:xylulose kinase n=1 Tax=Drosophila obscura TaxID=7282 RepID=UPI001BB198FE|nr:xylulose kinase [Drosophila obscura]XP_041450771.1 xylulose kinase [Drosophila obscura]